MAMSREECDFSEISQSKAGVPRISVVCLSYNRPHLLREALRSIQVQSYPIAEVLVVDNRSDRSDEVASVVAEFSGIVLLANPTNLGFTGGMNTGLRTATGDYIVITEDDITLSADAIQMIVERLSTRTSASVVGGMMLNKMAGTIRCVGGQIKLGGRFELRVIGENETDVGQYSEPFAVSYLPGAFLAARREVWNQLGGFRERYFAYMEDVDLCLRASAAGILLEVLPAVRVWHADPSGECAPAWLDRLKDRNLFRVYLLNAPSRVLPEFIARYGVWDAAHKLLGRQPGRWNRLLTLVRTLMELPQLLYERRFLPTLHGRSSRG